MSRVSVDYPPLCRSARSGSPRLVVNLILGSFRFQKKVTPSLAPAQPIKQRINRIACQRGKRNIGIAMHFMQRIDNRDE